MKQYQTVRIGKHTIDEGNDKMSPEIFSFHNRMAIAKFIAIAILLFMTIFLTLNCFVEAQLLSKSYAFISGSFLCFLISVLTFQKSKKLNIDILTVSLALFASYLLIRTLCVELVPNSTFVLSIIAFVLLFFAFRFIPRYCYSHIDTLIVLACLSQAVYGVMLYLGIFYKNFTFGIAGSFDNPAGFAACLSVGFPFCFSLLDSSKYRRYLGIISSVVISGAIVLSESRAGMAAVLIISLLYLANRYWTFIKQQRRYIIPLAVVVAATVIWLFLLKKDSTLGRILIWENSLNMIKDAPIFGQGAGAFMGKYMGYQADYFKVNPDGGYSLLADNVTHPFNEFLLLIIEYGIIGLLLLAPLVVIIAKAYGKNKLIILPLLSMAVFSCFSYPLRYSFVLVIIAYCLAKVESKGLFRVQINHVAKAFMVIGLVPLSVLFYNDVNFEKRWKDLTRKPIIAQDQELLESYKSIYTNSWNGDPIFLYNYGAVLNRAKAYTESNAILTACEKYFDSYDVKMILADNCLNLGQQKQAESYYMTAQDMIPCKFMPLYKLMMLYQTTENKSRLLDVANTILNKNVKVPSGTVSYIKLEAQKIIDNTR